MSERFFGLMYEERQLLKAIGRGVAKILEEQSGNAAHFEAIEIREKVGLIESAERLHKKLYDEGKL